LLELDRYPPFLSRRDLGIFFANHLVSKKSVHSAENLFSIRAAVGTQRARKVDWGLTRRVTHYNIGTGRVGLSW